MTASVYKTSSSVTTGSGHRLSTKPAWVVTISDANQGWNFTTTQGYNGAGASAEWIVEAPEVGHKIATLNPYTIAPPSGMGDFDNAGVLSTIVTSGAPTYTSANLNYANDSGVMIQNKLQVSTPGTPTRRRKLRTSHSTPPTDPRSADTVRLSDAGRRHSS